ncbi:glutathione S-transferase family protein [Marinobacterium rhizophilum]|uniref:Glutathione S-transferase family protein n=1 Tax=Marinobacterium rhizophilum TaxID=420402 RepID=A0ABY5HQ22_9GAMM|nr:glutathione S-transferase family protein [Marinobacterium rhizophilum]UTW13307.1 glutathione S-transferase family protein [Marinobacterium rhizophilum]
MGLLVDGQWHDQWYDTESRQGAFVRDESRFRNWIGDGDFPAEAGRYHLYVSLACPWAHRTLIARRIKGLEDIISVSSVHPLMASNGWEYQQDPAFANPDHPAGDPLYHSRFHHELYTRAQRDYSGRVTVPLLWDKQRHTIVSNESADIMRMFNSAFSHLVDQGPDLYPPELRHEIDEINAFVYTRINNGVYRCGFATTQSAYREAFDALFDALDRLERRLGQQRYLLGARITEADWRLFTTLVRFDAVYHGHFKTNLRTLSQYPNLSGYLRELYQWPGISTTVDMRQIKHHYYRSHSSINPTGIVPEGPALALHEPHDRARFNAQFQP